MPMTLHSAIYCTVSHSPLKRSAITNNKIQKLLSLHFTVHSLVSNDSRKIQLLPQTALTLRCLEREVSVIGEAGTEVY